LRRYNNGKITRHQQTITRADQAPMFRGRFPPARERSRAIGCAPDSTQLARISLKHTDPALIPNIPSLAVRQASFCVILTLRPFPGDIKETGRHDIPPSADPCVTAQPNLISARTGKGRKGSKGKKPSVSFPRWLQPNMRTSHSAKSNPLPKGGSPAAPTCTLLVVYWWTTPSPLLTSPGQSIRASRHAGHFLPVQPGFAKLPCISCGIEARSESPAYRSDGGA
jgi:hypothetical protein